MNVTIDGVTVEVAAGATLLDACQAVGVDTPTLCFGETLAPANVCRVCVVEVEGSRALVPACSREAADGMVVHTDSPRVRTSRRMVIELLGSSVDLSHAPDALAYAERYGADPARLGTPERQPATIDNDLYVRDYSRCILCYKCVDACGEQWQNTFAIAVAGRGADAHISTEYGVGLPDSACVYCGNCVAVCPTGALLPKREFDLREAGTWDEAAQSQVDTVCPYCGVGCHLTLHVQNREMVKVTSPDDHDTTRGNLCVKGRFGWQYVR